MRILAFDTATRATTVALLDTSSGAELQARDDPPASDRPRHTTQLMALIDHVLARAGCGWDDIDRLAVGIGPGTFTGLRIGVATARALARARNIELVGVSTLRSLALAAGPEAERAGCEVTLPALDARRREVFAAAWPSNMASVPTHVAALLEPLAIAPAALAEQAVRLGDSRLVVGDGAVAFRPVLDGSGTVIPGDQSHLHRVDATFHCRLAERAEPGAAADVVPQYLRAPDAELALQASQRP